MKNWELINWKTKTLRRKKNGQISFLGRVQRPPKMWPNEKVIKRYKFRFPSRMKKNECICVENSLRVFSPYLLLTSPTTVLIIGLLTNVKIAGYVLTAHILKHINLDQPLPFWEEILSRHIIWAWRCNDKNLDHILRTKEYCKIIRDWMELKREDSLFSLLKVIIVPTNHISQFARFFRHIHYNIKRC